MRFLAYRRAPGTLARHLNRWGPLILLVTGIGWFFVSEHLDQRWQEALRPARCRVISSRIDGRIVGRAEPTMGDRQDYRAEYVERTALELEVERAGMTRTVREIVDYRLDPKEPRIACWVADEAATEVVLSPDREMATRLKGNLMSSALLFILGALWMTLKR